MISPKISSTTPTSHYFSCSMIVGLAHISFHEPESNKTVSSWFSLKNV